MEYFKETREQSDGSNALLVFKEGMCNMIQDALKKRDFPEDAIILARAASIIRKDMKAFSSTDLFRKNVKTRHCHQVSRPSFP